MNLVVQNEFAAAVLDPLRPAPADVRARRGIDAQRRFAVHRNNAVITLVDALADAFPVVRALVGDDFFRRMARERVRTDPPRSPILAEYGEGFCDFIDVYPAAASVRYLGDIARLEHLRIRAYHARDAEAVVIEAYRELAAMPQRLENICVRLHPACCWMRSSYAVRSIWSAHQGMTDPADAELDAIAIDTAEDVLVTRPRWDVSLIELPAGGAAFLQALHDGGKLADATARAMRDAPDAQAQTLLLMLITHGLAVELFPYQDSPT